MSFGLLVGTERVEHAQLEALGRQQEVLVLRVDVDEALAQQLHDGERYGCVVDEGTALARGGYLAAYDALGVVLNLVLFEQRLQFVACDVEGSLDDTFRSSLAYGGSLGTLSGEQPDGTEEDRLTGTRFARDNGETFCKVEVEQLDERIVLYM